MTLAIALLAAGQSRRMRGRDKLLEEIDGKPLLRLLAERVLASGVGPLAATLPPESPARVRALQGLPLACLAVADAAEGLSASLRAAARWAKKIGASGVMICPADLPELTAADFAHMAAAFFPQGPPLRACSQCGTPGHPVVFPARMFGNLEQLSGDTGARNLLEANPLRLVPLPGTHATTDLDTPEDWAAWRRDAHRRTSTDS